MKKKNIVISILGVKKDALSQNKASRWNMWRPNVGIVQHEEFLIDELHLISEERHTDLANLIKSDIKKVSPHTTVIHDTIVLQNPWDFEEVYGIFYDYSRNPIFHNENNNYFVHISTGSHVEQICLFLLTESRHFPGKLIQTSPIEGHGIRRTSDPRGTYTIIDLDLSRYDKLAKRFEEEYENSVEFLKCGIKTRNEAFNNLIEMIERVAERTIDPILLTGPTGAGKSKLAHKIYELKRNKNKLVGGFVETNCATLRGDMAMATLFGHTKGAFTGATTERQGLLKSADGGILFLDEIGELGLDEQAMLLRAIEDKSFLPIGADKETHSDFQLICGTNKDLRKCVINGTFRADLLARINLWEFNLPGLADRREDIEPNLDYELKCFAEKYGKHITINKEARDIFLEYAHNPTTEWNENFRELNAMVTRMSTLCNGGRIDKNDVKIELARKNTTTSKKANINLCKLLGSDYTSKYDLFDLVQLEKVIEVCLSTKNRTEAGKQLFSISRLSKNSSNDSDRLGKYLAKFNLTFQQIKELAD